MQQILMSIWDSFSTRDIPPHKHMPSPHIFLLLLLLFCIALSAGAVEYADCTSAEG